MTTDGLTRRAWLNHLLVVWLLLFAVEPATAQTTDDLFDDSVVQTVHLRVHPRDWEKLKEDFRFNDYYPADLQWRDLVVRNIGIRSRGSGSRSGQKPGLRLDFDRYGSAQEFLGLKSLVLDNLSQDPSMVKERVGMRFFQRMGYPAPRTTHARLYVNGEYAGLYAIVESIDKAFLGRVFGRNLRGNIENDGYLYEYHWMGPYHFEYLGRELERYAALFEPKTREHESMSALYGPIEDMIRTINEVRDDEFASAVGEHLDLSVFVQYVAIESFLADYDGFLGFWGVNNFYFYRFEQQKRGQFLPWDKDTIVYSLGKDVLEGALENVLTRRALTVPELRAAYLGWLIACAKAASEPALQLSPTESRGLEISAGWLEREAARAVEQIRVAAYEDPLKPYSNEEFEAEVTKVMDFARERSNAVMRKVLAVRFLTR